MQVGSGFTISVVGRNGNGAIQTYEVKHSVLVPMLVAMFGAEAGAQMPAPPDHNRAVGATVAAKSAAAVIQDQPAYAASFVS